MIKGSCDFMEGSSSLYVTMKLHLVGFDGDRHRGRGDMFLIYHVTSRDHVFKGLFDFIGGGFS